MCPRPASAIAAKLGLALAAALAAALAPSLALGAPPPPSPALQASDGAAAATTPPEPPPPQLVEVDPANYRMVLAGDIVLGLSGVGMVTMAVGLGIRADAQRQRSALGSSSNPDPAELEAQEQRVELGATLALVGGAAAGALLITGITLVALGYSREHKRRAALPALSLSPAQLGASWALAF